MKQSGKNRAAIIFEEIIIMNSVNRKAHPCSRCGQEFAPEQLIPFQDELLCPVCLDEQTTVCSCCGERIYKTDNSGTDTIPLCEDCYDNHYERCTHCGALIHRRDTYYRGDDPYCYDCYHTLPAQGINDYYFKPEPIFYGTGKRYFGVELEVDEGGESDSNAERVLDIANSDRELIYCKHDGSLNDGFEIVTHPMTLDFHENNMPWAEIMEEAKKMGYLSHQAETCGLHVHVNRTTFGNTESEQEAAIARVLYFFEKFWEELLKFSRRTQRQLDHWAARYGYKEKPKDILDHAKGHNSAGRYTAVNLTNRDTVEFRMFRGTLKYSTLIATLELLDNICEMAVYLTDKDVQGLSWTSFVVGCTQPELVQYLKERRLYVNDAVASEEDV